MENEARRIRNKEKKELEKIYGTSNKNGVCD